MKLWIARDKDETLRLFQEKPTLDIYYWFDNSLGMTGCIAELLKADFPEVTFENSPQEVELKLVNEIVGVVESPLKTFPRVNEFEVGASYRR